MGRTSEDNDRKILKLMTTKDIMFYGMQDDKNANYKKKYLTPFADYLTDICRELDKQKIFNKDKRLNVANTLMTQKFFN